MRGSRIDVLTKCLELRDIDRVGVLGACCDTGDLTILAVGRIADRDRGKRAGCGIDGGRVSANGYVPDSTGGCVCNRPGTKRHTILNNHARARTHGNATFSACLGSCADGNGIIRCQRKGAEKPGSCILPHGDIATARYKAPGVVATGDVIVTADFFT